MPDAAAPSTIDTTPPAEYLRQDPTREEHALAEQCDAHDGAHVPWWRFAKLAVRLHSIALWTSSMDVLFRRARRYVLAAVSAAAVNLSALGIWYVHRVEANATAAERSAELERRVMEYRDGIRQEIQDLRLDVRELRAALRRLSGADPAPNSDRDWLPSNGQHLPDKLSLLKPQGPTCTRLDLTPVIHSQPSL